MLITRPCPRIITRAPKQGADEKKKAKMIIALFEGVEKIVGNRDNAGYQYFLVFPQCF